MTTIELDRNNFQNMMKFKWQFFFVAFLFLAGCNSDTPVIPDGMGCEGEAKEFSQSLVDAVLVRPDIAACLCCGGYILEVKNVLFKFENFPVGTSSDLKNLEYPNQYPVPVKVEFEFSRTCGEIAYVSVSSIQSR